MYTVALVDDEKWILADLIHTFPFEDYGFTVQALYTSAIKAARELPALQPDVVFVDIRMPALSGLDLIDQLKRELAATVFIILSGYAEFSYAQRALHLKVFDYCLKPVEREEACALLDRLSAKLVQIRPDHPAASEQLSQLLRYVDDHIYEKLVLEKLAADFYLSANYCGQLFKAATGKTFSKYVRDRRLARAQELLSSTRLPIKWIASQVGYDDLHYFTRVFSSVHGVSPRAYRQRLRKGE